MTENYMVNLVAWIILYASFWLTKHNPVSTAFRRRECHTGFLAKWLEKTIFPFRWYGSRPTYEYAIGLLLLCCILLSSIACGYYNNFQIEYKCILVHLKRLIPYAFSFSSKSTETLLSELQKAAKGNAVAQAILRYQQDNSFKCKSDSDQISIQKFFPTCGLMDEYFRWLLL